MRVAMAMTVLLVGLVSGSPATAPIQVDSCTFSGNGHVTTLDGARYDLHGSGVLSAISNGFLQFQVELQPTSATGAAVNQSYWRGAALAVRGDGLCRADDCPGRHTLTIAFGAAVADNVTSGGSRRPDRISIHFQDGNSSQAAAPFVRDVAVDELRGGGALDADTARVLNQTAVTLQATGPDQITVVVRLDVQAPIVVSIGAGFATISTEALGGALAGDNGLCGLYSRTAVDDFGGAVAGAKADFYSDERLSNWARQFQQSAPLLVPERAAPEYRAPSALTTVPNRIEFWTADQLLGALQACPGAIGNVSFRLCVRDWMLDDDEAVIALSNYAVVGAAQRDADLVASLSPLTATPTIVERRESAKTSTTVATAISASLGAAFVFGLFANRRLRERHAKELTSARANAIRLADNL